MAANHSRSVLLALSHHHGVAALLFCEGKQHQVATRK